MLKTLVSFTGVIVLLVFNQNCSKKNDVDFKTHMLNELNKQRLKGCVCGEDSMPPVDILEYDEALENAAERHVLDMSDNDFLSHIGTDGSTPQLRASEAGFTGAFIGENIARGFVTVNDVMARWLSSEEHCKTIMAPYFSYVGIAYKDYYWVQVYGSD